jgi:N-acyl-D-amino-acid deacylase
MGYDLVVRNGTVVDGTRLRVPRRSGADRRAHLGLGFGSGKGRVEIDASGLIVAPGFIDAHTHDDRLMLSAPEMAPKVSQGVTTVVAGNCGISLAPAPRGMRAPVLPPIDLLDDAGGWFRFRTFGAYVEELNARPAATNCALLVGHTMLRAQTMEDLQRPATENEIEEMRRLTAEALAAGAIGVSTGLYYEPRAPRRPRK